MKWIVNKYMASTWRCSKCSRLVPDPGYVFCPHCGEQTDAPYDAMTISEKWIPVDEKMPKDTKSEDVDNIKNYLISYRREGKVETNIAFFTDGGWFWHIGNPVSYEVTAWAPLPEAYKTWEDIENGS